MGLQEMPAGRESICPPAVVVTVTRETISRLDSGIPKEVRIGNVSCSGLYAPVTSSNG